MIIIMKRSARQEEIDHIIQIIESNGLDVHLSTGKEVTLIGVIGDKTKLQNQLTRNSSQFLLLLHFVFSDSTLSPSLNFFKASSTSSNLNNLIGIQNIENFRYLPLLSI